MPTCAASCETTSLHGPDAQRTAKGSAMQSNLVSFIQVLRTHDVRVSPAETLDAMAVAATLGYANRNLLRDGLAMTLAKTPDEEAVFHACFDRFFYQRLSDFSREDSQASAEPEVTSSAGDSPSLPGQETGLRAADEGAQRTELLGGAEAAGGCKHAARLGHLVQALTGLLRRALHRHAQAVGVEGAGQQVVDRHVAAGQRWLP